MNVVFN